MTYDSANVFGIKEYQGTHAFYMSIREPYALHMSIREPYALHMSIREPMHFI